MLPIALSLLSGLAAASPIAYELEARNNGGTNFVSPDFLNLTYSSPYNAQVQTPLMMTWRGMSLPNVVIMATGGTIAGKGAGAASSGVYQAGEVGIAALVEAVPDLLNISNIYGYQIVNVDSGRINSTIQLDIARAANALLCADDSTVSGVVVTHGTDTLDETAFFLDATVNCQKPVVIVGSMRPSTAYSADGPANLLQAVTVAASEESKNRGALISMNDRVGQAYYTQKTHLNFVDTFKAPEPGYVGAFYNNKLYYFSTAAQPTFKKTFDVAQLTSLPRVDILYGQQEFDARLLESALSYGDVKGIIVPGPDGAGLNDEIIDRVAGQIPVVLAWRINNGLVGPEAVKPESNSTISAGLVNSHKSRILLQLALATGKDPREVFEAQLRQTLYGN